MIRNYIKIGFRNLWKYKSSTVINVLGLSTGLAAFLLITLFVNDELSYDRHFDNAERIYRVTVKNFSPDGQLSRHWAFASAGHAERLKEDYPAITHATRFFPWAFPDIIVGEQEFPSEPVVFADDDVFDIFSFPFLIGSPENAFEGLRSIVLTERTAVRLFGNDWREQDLLGKTVELSSRGQSAPFEVTGVIEDMPDQQHFHFEYLAPLRFLDQLLGEDAMNNVGGNYNWMTFFMIEENGQLPSAAKVTEEFFNKYMGERNGRPASDFYEFVFQPITSIHLYSNLEGEYEANGSIQQVYIFSVVGILLLLVACVNYMNLATSHFTRRMKEIGVRKVSGASRSTLVKQFLTESSLVTLVSFPVALCLVFLALDPLNQFVEKSMSLSLIANGQLLLVTLVVLLIVGALAGLYPALFLSKVDLIQALKGEQAVNSSKWNFRSLLVTFQYAVTIALIFAILVIESQMAFINNTDAGYRRDQIIHLSLGRGVGNLETFKRELTNHPNILQATYASRIPTGRLMDNAGSSIYKGDTAVRSDFRLPYIRVDHDFVSTFEIQLIAGEDFTEDQEMVKDSTGYYIVNRKATQRMGFATPSEAVGARLSYGSFSAENGSLGRIIGVVEDFHFESLKTPIVPMVMMHMNDGYRRICLKVKPEGMSETLKHIDNTWAQFDPETTANYRFLDDLFADQYQQEERLSQVIKVFTVVAILISCLGLIGMVGFIIETKIKEIGIRKVLGASVSKILLLVASRFLVLLVIGFVVALPIAYWFMSGWLDTFVYKTNISVFLMLAPVLLAGLLTLLSISYQTIRASLVNPVECLKDE
ncbi:MAG: FtsX-like permease family protein [Bacteroidota bacterium]